MCEILGIEVISGDVWTTYMYMYMYIYVQLDSDHLCTYVYLRRHQGYT